MANWKRIRELRDFMATLNEEQVRMDKLLWINRDKETIAEARNPTCGSVCCIRGWAGLMFGGNNIVDAVGELRP